MQHRRGLYLTGKFLLLLSLSAGWFQLPSCRILWIHYVRLHGVFSLSDLNLHAADQLGFRVGIFRYHLHVHDTLKSVSFWRNFFVDLLTKTLFQLWHSRNGGY